MHEIENGIHDIPNEVYHASSGLSRSAVMEFKRSPYHYFRKYLSLEAVPSFNSPAMKLGELVHALVLEPKYFNERYAFKPEIEQLPPAVLMKEVGKEEYEKVKAARKEVQDRNQMITDEFLKESEGKEIITYEMYQEALSYSKAVLSDSIAQSLFVGVEAEKSIYFTHKLTGLQCKVRPDAWIGGVVTDLKTCADASYEAFQRAAYSGGYFIQAAMIKQALESLNIELEKFIFYCVEKTFQRACTYYLLDDDTIERAENEFNNLMYGIAYCKENNAWGSYEPRTLTYPNWAK